MAYQAVESPIVAAISDGDGDVDEKAHAGCLERNRSERYRSGVEGATRGQVSAADHRGRSGRERRQPRPPAARAAPSA